MKLTVSVCRRVLRFMPVVLALLVSWNSQAGGAWTPLTNPAPSGLGIMLVLSDGTVMAQDYAGTNWYRLTPDKRGSYVNGTWSSLAPMHYPRAAGLTSQVLRDGRVLLAGSEIAGPGENTAEVYDPISDTWTVMPPPPTGQTLFYDCISETLPNGNVLVAPDGPAVFGGTDIYDITSNTWTNGPTLYRGFFQDEASWVKLADGSILTIDPPIPQEGQFGTNSERYIPSLNQWVNDADVSVTIYDTNGEMGPGFLLPDGRAIFFGGTGHTAIYTPSGTTNQGSWSAGPDFPNGQGTTDAPGAMLANGKILCAVGPASTYSPPTSFYEYDPVANSFAQVNGPIGVTDDDNPYGTLMLDLPDGTVLFHNLGDPQVYSYQPGGAPLASGNPAITGITQNTNGSFHLTGTLLNGISEGAAYGDDYQMASDYPIVRLSDSSGNVYYARSFNWSTTSIMTGSTPETVEFTLPAGLVEGTYSLAVVANGISSDPVAFAAPGLPIPPVTGLEFTLVSSNQISFQWSPVGSTETGYLIERSTDGLTFTIVAALGQTNTIFTDLNVTPLTPYYYRIIATNAVGSSDPLEALAASSPATPLAGPWLAQDVGAVNGHGASSFSGGTYTLIGTGNGIGGMADQFQFAWQPVVGDATITARVTASQNTSSNVLAGVTIRDSLMGGAANVSMGFSASNGKVYFQSRVADREGMAIGAGPGSATLPRWVRLVRSVDTITGFSSADGVTWIQRGTVNIALGQIVHVGLFSTSGTNGLTATSTFDNVTVTGAPASITAPITVTLNGANPLNTPVGSAFVDPGVTVGGPPIGIAAGNGNNLVLKADGTIEAWGTAQTNVPSDATNVVAIIDGDYHSLALKADGTVTGWGYNFWGQATPPAGLSNVTSIAAGYGHSMALKGDGTIVAWGDDDDNETNVPSEAANVIAIAAGGEHSMALKSDGTVVGWGDDTYGQNEPPGDVTNVIAIAETGDCSVALKADGTVVCWGFDGVGETVPPPGATNLVGVAGGSSSEVILAMKSDGSVIGWGYSGRGQTTIPDNATNVAAVITGATQELALRSDGMLVIWGNADFGPTNVPPDLKILDEVPFLIGSVNANLPGDYSLGYGAADLAGALASVSRNVVVGVPPPIQLKGLMMPAGGGFQLSFTNVPGLNFSVHGSTNLALSLATWPLLGPAQEVSLGHYQFTDSQVTNVARRFYSVSLP